MVRMNKILISILLVFPSLFLFGNTAKLEQTRIKYSKATSIQYQSTAFYPNPETDEISTFTVQYHIYLPENVKYDFYSKYENEEEYYKTDEYFKINHEEKTIFKYESKQNQNDALKSSRLAQYGPVSLLRNNWEYNGEKNLEGKNHAHYSFVESVSEYEGKIIKVIFQIYIADDFTLAKFERKVYIDKNMTQNVTYNFTNYIFSNQKSDLQINLPKTYSLKYFERLETAELLKKNAIAPNFIAKDINGKTINFPANSSSKTLLLFSSTNCGASAEVSHFLRKPEFRLEENLKLINIFGTDSFDQVSKHFKNHKPEFQIVAAQKSLESRYKINGYPIMYLVDEKGIIEEVFDGYTQILDYFKKMS